VEGQWILGGVERGSNKIFLICVPNQMVETLEEILVKFVEHTIIISSNCWRNYNMDQLHFRKYFHQMVNFSL